MFTKKEDVTAARTSGYWSGRTSGAGMVFLFLFLFFFFLGGGGGGSYLVLVFGVVFCLAAREGREWAGGSASFFF